jgi:type VI secretion system lysozyme-like protein
MSQPKSLVGIPAPLFEKLTDLSPTNAEDDQDLIFQSRDALVASIKREVARILDTRLPWPELPADQSRPQPADEDVYIPPDRNATVIGYGVPDLTHLCIRGISDRATIERRITEAIRAFEPRLVDPVVRIAMNKVLDGAHVEIQGAVRTRRALEPLRFIIDLGIRTGDQVKRALLAARQDPGKKSR